MREVAHVEFGKDSRILKIADSVLLRNIIYGCREREHLSYELFMEDWEEYCNDRQTPKDGMTVEIAVDFLEVMQ